MNGTRGVGSSSNEVAADSVNEDCPYDERPVVTKNRHVFWQTRDSIRALANSTCRNPSSNSDQVAAQPCGGIIPSWARKRSTSVASAHPWDQSTIKPRLSLRSAAKCSSRSGSSPSSQPCVDQLPKLASPVSTIGHPDLQLYCTNTPEALLHLLPVIIAKCEDHVAQARQGDWKTRLYSLTLQDVPLTEVPGGRALTQGLTDWVLQLVLSLYAGCWAGDASGRDVGLMRSVTMDSYQPHLLKYCGQHAGAALHYDRCDVTVQLTLSASSDYDGGGTHFPALGATLRLEQGQLLLHPGRLLHAGCDIRRGTRYLLVWFLHLQAPR